MCMHKSTHYTGVLCVQRWQPRTSATCHKWPLKWCELFTLAFTFHHDVHYKQSGKSDGEVKWRKEKPQQLPAWAASAPTVWTLHSASYHWTCINSSWGKTLQNLCGSPKWKSSIILLRISIMLPWLKCGSAKFLLMGGACMYYIDVSGICASTQCVWAPPLMEVLSYSTSNTVMRSKHATE